MSHTELCILDSKSKAIERNMRKDRFDLKKKCIFLRAKFSFCECLRKRDKRKKNLMASNRIHFEICSP